MRDRLFKECTVTKKVFIRAAEMVRSIRDGNWTNEPPSWADSLLDYHIPSKARAVQTAEAFLQLFKEYNPRFDQQRFLMACGLVDAPVKVKHPRKRHTLLTADDFRGGYRCDNNPNGPTED